MPHKQTRREFQRSLLSERQLILRNVNKYQHLTNIGYTHQQAVKKLVRGTKMDSLSKLQHRVGIAENTVGTTAVSLDGIRITNDVKSYIEILEEQKVIKPYRKGQMTLYLMKPKVWNP